MLYYHAGCWQLLKHYPYGSCHSHAIICDNMYEYGSVALLQLLATSVLVVAAIAAQRVPQIWFARDCQET